MSNPRYYAFEQLDFKDHQDAGPWRSYDLCAEGSTIDEMLDSAVYRQTDQDGGSLGEVLADDPEAQKFILSWCKEYGVPAVLPEEGSDAIDPESGMRLAQLKRPRQF